MSAFRRGRDWLPMVLVTAQGTTLGSGCGGETLFVGQHRDESVDTSDTPSCLDEISDWSEPNEQPDCSEADEPTQGDWVDDFDTDGQDLGFEWHVEDDGTGDVRLRPDPGIVNVKAHEFKNPSLENKGRTRKALRMAGCKPESDTAGNSWGVKWFYETQRTGLDNRAIDAFRHVEGIGFWARLTDDAGKNSTRIMVEFPTAATVPSAEGGDGRCERKGAFLRCYNHFGTGVTLEKSCWKFTYIAFESLICNDYGACNIDPHISFDKDSVFGIQFSLGNTSPPQFDVLIDDIRLYGKSD